MNFRFNHRWADHADIQNEGPAECPLCDEVFDGYQNVKNHVADTHQNLNIKCEECDEVFRNLKARRNHMAKAEVNVFSFLHFPDFFLLKWAQN